MQGPKNSVSDMICFSSNPAETYGDGTTKGDHHLREGGKERERETNQWSEMPFILIYTNKPMTKFSTDGLFIPF